MVCRPAAFVLRRGPASELQSWNYVKMRRTKRLYQTEAFEDQPRRSASTTTVINCPTHASHKPKPLHLHTRPYTRTHTRTWPLIRFTTKLNHIISLFWLTRPGSWVQSPDRVLSLWMLHVLWGLWFPVTVQKHTGWLDTQNCPIGT